jgi:hypothetical protein
MDYNEITSRLVLAFQEQVGVIQQQATKISILETTLDELKKIYNNT